MKKALILCFALIGFSIPAFAEFRMDVGFDVPRGLGGLANGGLSISADAAAALDNYIFPFPEVGFYYQGDVGPLRMGAGVRAFTFILETVYWPNAFVELDAGRFVIAFQLGGGLFGTFGVFNNIATGAVLIPDLSAWFKIGNTFRIGGGALGFMLPELSDGIVFAYYLGLKFAIDFK